jgi:hypothetical protein
MDRFKWRPLAVVGRSRACEMLWPLDNLRAVERETERTTLPPNRRVFTNLFTAAFLAVVRVTSGHVRRGIRARAQFSNPEVSEIRFRLVADE